MNIERNASGEIEISLDEGESFSHSSVHFKSEEGSSHRDHIRIHNVKSLRLDRSIEEEAQPKEYSEYKF